MMRIALGTMSELKVRSAKNSLIKFGVEAEIIPCKTESGIPNQPIGLTEITLGAKNRAAGALEQTNADIGIGIESGIIQIDDLKRWSEIPVVIVKTKEGKISFAYGAAHPLPDWAVEEVLKDHSELGTFIRRIDPTAEKDPIKYFSDSTVAREDILSQAISCALIEIFKVEKFINPEVK